jgi:hypothetical protein
MMSDTWGLTFYAPLGKWDRDSQSWRTSEATSLWALTLSSLTLPTWGGLHDGELCEHPTPAHLTSVLDCLSLPTPTTEHSSGGYNPAWGHGMTLLDAAKVIVGAPPGPATLLPTPAVNDMGRGKTPEDWDAWTDKMRAAHGNGNGHGKSLEIEAMRLLPTPLAEMGNLQRDDFTPNLRTVIEGNRLLPGATTAPPSPDGSTSSDDPHPHLLSLDGLATPA